MPVTAKLSKRFYEALGEQVANELVDWFNSVDATYRADLRELNELNFARFDAKVEQRFAGLRADFDRCFAELDAKIDVRTAELRADFDRRFAELEAKFEKRFAEFDVKLANLRADLVRWMLAFWLGTMAVTLATLIAVILK
jgi:Skp family chaperone for outer membrane proteins